MKCVSLAEKSLERYQEILPRIDLAEIRIDLWDPSEEEVGKVFSLHKNLIATYRPGNTPQKKREKILLKAIASGAAYVDVEHDAPGNYQTTIVAAAKAQGCKVIISYHNYDMTPSREKLLGVIDTCFTLGADIVKVACHVNKPQDNDLLLTLLEDPRDIIVVGMGDLGRVVREVAPFTYCALEAGKETALGQKIWKPRFAVFGKPILHSKSPDIFRAASLDYSRVMVDCAEDIIPMMHNLEIHGCNITAPFKEQIIPYLDDMSEEARDIGAVNFVYRKAGKYYGMNTDHIGVTSSLGEDLKVKKAVVVGAGGAARAAVYGLKLKGAEVFLGNRSFERGKKVSEELGCRLVPWKCLEKEISTADILVSCIPGGNLWKNRNRLRVLDANYTYGLSCQRSGLDWLRYQAEPVLKMFGKEYRETPYNEGVLRNNIVLVGFMGSGKSSVGRAMADNIHYDFVDLDDKIEKETGMSILDIFEEKGEQVFRDLEKKALDDALKGERQVIACGGGVTPKVENAVVVFLWVSLEEAFRRLKGCGKRPLLKNARCLFSGRQEKYFSIADLIVSTEGKTPQELARRIADECSTL